MGTNQLTLGPVNPVGDQPMMRRTRILPKVTIGLACLVLTFAVLLNIVPQVLFRPEASKHEPLSAAMMNPPPGWSVTELPLASSPDGQLQVAKVLQFDDASFMRYTNASGVAVDIYAAYWSPGKAPYTLVGAHTPDTCWIYSGWQCVARTHDFRFESPEFKLKSGEVGTFTFQQKPTYVIFWHLVGGEPHESLGLVGWVRGLRGYLVRVPMFFRDLRRYSFDLTRDQLFVRVSSSMPVTDLLSRPDVQELLRALKPLNVIASERTAQR